VGANAAGNHVRKSSEVSTWKTPFVGPSQRIATDCPPPVIRQKISGAVLEALREGFSAEGRECSTVQLWPEQDGPGCCR